jgi:hypothetical protein
MHSSLSELSYKTYVFLFDVKYFAKSLKDCGYEENDINNITKDVETLYKYMLHAIELKSDTEQYEVLTDALNLSETLLNDFKSIKCKEQFLNEKTDLLVETFAISEKLKIIMEQLLKK